MKWARGFVLHAVIGGVLVVMPVYLTVLVLLHAMKSVVGLVRPLTLVIPDWLARPARTPFICTVHRLLEAPRAAGV